MGFSQLQAIQVMKEIRIRKTLQNISVATKNFRKKIPEIIIFLIPYLILGYL